MKKHTCNHQTLMLDALTASFVKIANADWNLYGLNLKKKKNVIFV